jgi:Asp-tRNA(Asn)/Glu-tRNA(Gln) amidotransferase A subunit family amidase
MNRKKITTLPLKELHRMLTSRELSVSDMVGAALESAPEAMAANAYIDWRPESLVAEAAVWDSRASLPPLAGLPVSVKDIFDCAGSFTTCASRFYRSVCPIPLRDAGYVSRWRRAGALMAGKTNLNEFAYGITGENITFGDCTIPGFPQSLTGGSSSGAAASVVAGSACLALGTDTGGSLRVPAALCGLVSYRQSLGFGEFDGLFPLAHSFDTVGWLQRHIGDVSWVASRLHPEMSILPRERPPRIAIPAGRWLDGVAPEIGSALDQLVRRLESAGATVRRLEASGFDEAVDLFVPIQAYDAFQAHASFWAAHQGEYDPAVRARIEVGSGISESRYQDLQHRRKTWVARVFDPLWLQADFLLAPAVPVARLVAGADHSATRPRLLRLTTPASLAGLPVLTTSHRETDVPGIGFQWMARRGDDTGLWALADWLDAQKVVF